MSCKHTGNDPNCSSYRGPYGDVDPYEKSWSEAKARSDLELKMEVDRYMQSSNNLRDYVEEKPVTNAAPETPDSKKYEILDVIEVGNLLILKVKYPNCAKCSYEGVKILVVKASLREAIFWNEIDPHFRGEKNAHKSAPSPLARFPATEAGEVHARAFAELIRET